MAKKYDVGYGKPPQKTQWKKGQSGNPAGAKAIKMKPKPLMQSLAEQLNEPVSITKGGKSQLVPFSEALATKLLHGLMSAPIKDQIVILQKLEGLGLFNAQAESLECANDDFELSEADRRLIEMAREDFGINFEGKDHSGSQAHQPPSKPIEFKLKKGGA
ncbi:MAG: DUF5681 domain-containing protein [Brevundimonas sp.]|jgi:hypothetical protein|nr:DUF5681 domain-containing protein [Brevundimonas sp.]